VGSWPEILSLCPSPNLHACAPSLSHINKYLGEKEKEIPAT